MSLPVRVERGVDPFESSQHEFDTMLGRLFGTRILGGDGGYLAPYGVDVREDGDHLYVEADMPGYRKEEVDINIENQMLTISAEHKAQTEQKPDKKDKGSWLLHKRRYSRFQRSFTLPTTVDSQTVSAKLNDGVLTITLNKREETKPRRITVA
jgi:HSP20 family protein